jgi:hypothetical protein
MSEQHFDIIGDVHGHADALRRLLVELGYGESGGAFRHDNRKAIFVGDFVDRGPDQREVLKIARDLCEADTASARIGWLSECRRTNGITTPIAAGLLLIAAVMSPSGHAHAHGRLHNVDARRREAACGRQVRKISNLPGGGDRAAGPIDVVGKRRQKVP